VKKTDNNPKSQSSLRKAGHGDVRLFKVDSLPEGVVPFETNNAAEGEATGHAHRLDQRYSRVFIDKKTKVRYLKVVAPSNLTHEEHHTRQAPPGLYRIGIVRETDHIEKVTRKVTD
jgi:hypothetical protein